MKNKILIISLSIILISCKKRNVIKEIYSIRLVNLTKHKVNVSFYEANDTTLIENNKLVGYSSLYIDTVEFNVTSSQSHNGPKPIIRGEGTPSSHLNEYNNRGLVWMQYTFEHKQSILQSSNINDCDTLSSELCNYFLFNNQMKPATDKTLYEFHEIRTYFITNQQYEHADSI